MKRIYLSPTVFIVHVQPTQCIVESPMSQGGPSADFMSNPDVSGVKSAGNGNYSVWDDAWSQEP